MSQYSVETLAMSEFDQNELYRISCVELGKRKDGNLMKVWVFEVPCVVRFKIFVLGRMLW